MDLITLSLHSYLKCAVLKFHTNDNLVCGTLIYIENEIVRMSIPMSILTNINPTTFSICITLFPFFLLDCPDINNIRAIQNHWNEEERISELIISEERCMGIGTCFSLQIRINILSDANGLTRSLWHKYFERLFLEASQVCELAYKLKNESDSIDIISM